MLPVALPSSWLKHFRRIYARSLDEQSPWLPQRRNACCMPLSGFVQSSLSSLWQPMAKETGFSVSFIVAKRRSSLYLVSKVATSLSGALLRSFRSEDALSHVLLQNRFR